MTAETPTFAFNGRTISRMAAESPPGTAAEKEKGPTYLTNQTIL